jgi:hypothetical protein
VTRCPDDLEETTMEQRMKNPAMVIREAMEAIQALMKSTYRGGTSARTLAR